MKEENKTEEAPLLDELNATVIEIHSGDSFTALPDKKNAVPIRFFLSSFRAPNPPTRSDPGKPLGL